MLTTSVIAKKRDGLVLSDEEIRFLVDGFVAKRVEDYQMSAFAMAVLLRGMTPEEIASLTRAMLESGERLPRDADGVPRVDKHSTGGLGDKVSLVLAPLLACHGVHVPMISGRGLGLTGGTLDKLESISGFRVDLSPRERERQMADVGCMIISASEKIAPADRELYRLRDVTATVESVALITASILSKKLAASLDALVMDVKVGSAAFMKTPADAEALAKSIVHTGKLAGLPTIALLTDMDQPLGAAVGNAIEVNESLDLLNNEGPSEVRELTIELCAELLCLCGTTESLDVARGLLDTSLRNGAARERFDRMVAAQGGKLTEKLPLAKPHVIVAQRGGYVESIDCQTLGTSVVEMGGGRRVKTDPINPRVGASVHCRIGDQVSKGQPLATIYVDQDAEHWASRLQAFMKLSDEFVAARPLIQSKITA
jgi:pyrimidine-nucleoside phosphorylase